MSLGKYFKDVVLQQPVIASHQENINIAVNATQVCKAAVLIAVSVRVLVCVCACVGVCACVRSVSCMLSELYAF